MDKDFFQLVRDGVRVFNPRDDGTWYDAAGVKEKFGVRPDQVVDVMALMGDTIDNIKGVPGIGEKGARELIGKYGSLDNLIAHASELTPKRRETLLANVDAAHQSRELARIHINVPVEFDPEALRYRGATPRAVLRDLQRARLPHARQRVRADRRQRRPHYRIVDTIDGVRALAARLQATGSFAFRVLPDRPSAMRASIVGLAFSTSPRERRLRARRAIGRSATPRRCRSTRRSRC